MRYLTILGLNAQNYPTKDRLFKKDSSSVRKALLLHQLYQKYNPDMIQILESGHRPY